MLHSPHVAADGTKARRHDEIVLPESIRLIAIDIDGTLLRTDKRLSKNSARAVAEATQHGIHVVLASARPPRSVKDIYHHLGLDTLAVNYNGALIHDLPRRRNVFHQPIPVALANRIVKLARKTDADVAVSAEILDKWYTDFVDPQLPTETSKRFRPDLIGPLESFMHVPVTKLMFLAPPQRLGRVYTVLTRKFGDKVNVLISDPHMIQVVHPEVDKAIGLAMVAEEYGVKREEVMAIGDAPNDVGMLRWAGLGVAMANAWPAARKAAKIVAPSNDDDGVAYAIRKFALERHTK